MDNNFKLTRGAFIATAVLALAGVAHARPNDSYSGPVNPHELSRAGLVLTVVDRDTGAELQQYLHRGQIYVAGRPGARYAIRMRSQDPGRLLAVVAVDGVNVLTGKTASHGDSGYVLRPWSTHEVTGWRKSDHEVAAFEFAALSDSYAARTGRPTNVGVIGVAVFNEVPPPPPPMPAPYADNSTFSSAREAGAASKMMAPRAATAGAPTMQESLGTGHGARETSVVTRTTFERASETPAQVLTIRYDRYENLVAAGVIPKRPKPRPGPNAFPASPEPGYVPDPPRRW